MANAARRPPEYGWSDRDLLAMARRILRENVVTEPPVTVPRIAKNYGITVSTYSFPPELKDLLGGLAPTHSFIAVDGDEPPEVQNATAARLFARAWLERLSQTPTGVVFLERKPIAADDKSDTERAADVLAAYLLMPPEMLEKFATVAPAESLARIFIVPEELVRWRLTLG